jgi:hypothetical protein
MDADESYIMCLFTVGLSLLAGTTLAISPTTRADDVKPAASQTGSVHRMEITNGPVRTVHLVGTNLSDSETQRLRDVESARNDVALANGLQALRMEYLNHEKRLERQRFETNYRLAGVTHAYDPGIYPDLVPVVDARILAESDPWRGWYGGYYGWSGWGYPGFGYGMPSGISAGTTSTATADDGAFRAEIMNSLAARATPEYAEQANRTYRAALSRAAESETIAKALGQPAGGVQPVAAELPREVVLRNGEKVSGTLVQRDKDWLVLDTSAGRVEVRATDVMMITTGKAK